MYLLGILRLSLQNFTTTFLQRGKVGVKFMVDLKEVKD